jgi:hypothetical protein
MTFEIKKHVLVLRKHNKIIKEMYDIFLGIRNVFCA